MEQTTSNLQVKHSTHKLDHLNMNISSYVSIDNLFTVMASTDITKGIA